METAGRSLSLEATLEEYRARFEGFFLPAVSRILRAESVPQLSEPSLYSLEAGGKRIRPLLVLAAAGLQASDLPAPGAAASLLPGPVREALFAAAAVECIHTYSLIHDDLPSMDDDNMRRGRPSCHRRFPEWAALLAGDTLNTFAFRLLAESGGDVAVKLRVLADAAGHAGMALGQALDLAHEKQDFGLDGPGEAFDLHFRSAAVRGCVDSALAGAPPGAVRSLLAIHLNKTGALIRASCELGAICSGLLPPLNGAGGSAGDALAEYGEGMGLLFQVVDDILDVVGDAALLGKRTGKDQALGKLTFPGLIGLEGSRGLAAELARVSAARLAGLADVPGLGRNVELLTDLASYVLHRDR